MSTLLLDGLRLTDDLPLLDDEAALPAQGAVAVSVKRWLADTDLLRARGEVGVLLPNTADVVALWPQLSGAAPLLLSFPTFPDGRAYSQGRLLRERCGCSADLRAHGAAVVRDQLGFMARVGFSSFALRADQDVEACRSAFADFSSAYQPAADAQRPAWLRFG